MSKTRHLTAQQAADALGVNPATLYAYVSRGLIRSESVEGDRRTRYYNAEDVQRLRDRKQQRKNPSEAVRQALHWGTPVLESALTLITDGGLYYRGFDALELATTHSIEDVAALLWTGDLESADRLFAGSPDLSGIWGTLGGLPPGIPALQRMQIALALGTAVDLGAYDLSPESTAHTGARIMQLMAAAAADNPSGGPGVAARLAQGWNQPSAAVASLINAALVMCADHELNVSSFAARVAASGDAQPYAVVAAGLAALQGAKHGGATQRAEALLREIGAPDQAGQAIANRLRRGETIPGFGHRLYPDGDPRARLLLGLIAQAMPGSPAVALADAVSARMLDAVGLAPTIDLGLAVLSLALDLPADSAVCLFAVGRAAGWVGHAIEQYAHVQLIRPRASYVGVPVRRGHEPGID